MSGTPDITIRYSEDAKEVIERVKNVFNMKVKYSRSAWVECLASLQYLRANIFSLSASKEDIVNNLMARKPHLNDMDTNLMALDKLDYILG